MRKVLFIASLFCSVTGFAQQTRLTVQEAVDLALKNNEGIKAATYEVESKRELKKTSFDLPKTNVSLLYGQYNGYAKQDNNFTITQAIPFTALGSQARLNRSVVASSELNKARAENELVLLVKQVYYELAYVHAQRELLVQQDSIFAGFLKSAQARYKTGETNLLEQTTAETQRNEVRNRLLENESTITILRTRLKTLLNSPQLPEIESSALTALPADASIDSTSVAANPSLAYMRQQVEVAHSMKRVEAAKFAPDLLIGYFNQTLIDVVNPETGAVATSGDRFSGFQLGLSIPLWFVPHQGRVKAAAYASQSAASSHNNAQIQLQGQLKEALQSHGRIQKSLDYYETSALPNADLILKQSQLAFHNGEIGYAGYLLGVRGALGIKENYLQTLNEYNQNLIYIEFLSGNK